MVDAEKTEAYECPDCGELYHDEDDASDCCYEPPIPEEVDCWRCGKCEALYDDEDEAKECCKEVE